MIDSRLAELRSALQSVTPPDALGGVRWVRRFGHPRNIDNYERPWIVWSGPTPGAVLTLNGKPLGAVSSGTSSIEAL